MYTSGVLLSHWCGIAQLQRLELSSLLSFTVLVVLRLKDEEQMLAERFGEQWQSYRQRTGRLLPRLR